ncbi:MAG TPA: hypothetical protein VH105_02625 [Burkholderiales bacterium]|nr:hypothetical protein [Burkholderiales bacterium]
MQDFTAWRQRVKNSATKQKMSARMKKNGRAHGGGLGSGTGDVFGSDAAD